MNTLLWEFVENLPKTAPGDVIDTVRALNIAKDKLIKYYLENNLKYDEENLKVVNLGSGLGSENMWLLENSKFNLEAVDAHNPYLEALTKKVEEKDTSLNSRLTVRYEDMLDLPYKKKTFDIIWCEGALHNIGFDEGVRYFKKFLKKGGVLVIADYVINTLNMPEVLSEYLKNFYFNISTIDSNIKVAEKRGLMAVASFIVPNSSWEDNYLHPISDNYKKMCEDNIINDSNKRVIVPMLEAVTMRDKYKKYYDYAFYIFQKI